MIRRSVSDLSVSPTLGAKYLAIRHEQIVKEYERTRDGHSAIGSMKVIAAQAIRELERAEKKSLDPADALRLEDEAA